MKKKRLTRSKKDRMLAGVCGGIAEYADMDPTLIRLIWAIGTLITGLFLGVLAYIVAMAIMPDGD